MNISRAEQSVIKYNQEQYRLDQARLEKQQTEEYAKKIEERRVDQMIAERVSRNFRLDLDKGRHIEILFDPNIVTYGETKRWNELKVYMELKYPDLYLGGIGDLTVEWIPIGSQFKVTEYDGSESIEYRDSENWLIA